MAWRRTETALFRKALAAVALWCLAWAVIGYVRHNAIPTYDARPGYREAMQACADDRLLASRSGELVARRPTRREMASCTESTRAVFIAAETGEQRRASLNILAWALLPSLLLLLLAAFARPEGG
jgi:hypothetical protein